jgi:hypothetical protein
VSLIAHEQESGNYTESFLSQYFRPGEGHVLDEEDAHILKWTAASIYSGGVHTVSRSSFLRISFG